jgi:hypothetical protein
LNLGDLNYLRQTCSKMLFFCTGMDTGPSGVRGRRAAQLAAALVCARDAAAATRRAL